MPATFKHRYNLDFTPLNKASFCQKQMREGAPNGAPSRRNR